MRISDWAMRIIQWVFTSNVISSDLSTSASWNFISFRIKTHLFKYSARCCSSHYSSCIPSTFKLALMKSTSKSFSSKVRISHLLLNEHFLNTDTRIINRIDLSTCRPSVIASSYWSHTGSPIMDIVFFSHSTTLTTGTWFFLF